MIGMMLPIHFRQKLLYINNPYTIYLNMKCLTRWKTLSLKKFSKTLIKKEKWAKFQSYSTDASSVINKCEWPLYNLQLNTCSDLYLSWFTMNVAADRPLSGLNMNVVYLDTWPSAPKDVPIILALHGIAYSHRFILPLIPYLIKNRVRIIAPNFPGCGYTPMDPEKHFSHTDQEKACFVKEFMETLGISKVDVLISHSAAVYPSIRLTNFPNDFTVKSLVLLMPGGMEPPVKYWTRLNVFLFASNFLRKIGLNILTIKLFDVYRWFQPNVKMNFEQADSAVKSLVYVNYDHVKFTLQRMSISKMPILLLYSKDDPVILSGIQSVIESSNLHLNSISYYDDQLQVFNPPINPGRKSYAIVLNSGKHEIETAHSQVIGEAISDLFQLIVKGT